MLMLACGDDASGSVSDAAAESGAPGSAQPKLFIATSATHACAMRQSGFYCWGENFYGQLGDGTTMSSSVPVKATVAGDDIVEARAHTGRTCVRRSTGEVACWGANDRGQIGDGTRDDSLVPIPVASINDARQIAIDEGSTCVLHGREGSVDCWGESPRDATDEGSVLPQPVPGVKDAVEVSAGAWGTYCARSSKGRVQCWRKVDGQWATPADVDALEGATSIALASREEVCGMLPSTEVVCHDLDNGKTVPLPDSKGSVEIAAAGLLALCARGEAGGWRCWNVLPVMLESVGTVVIPVESDVPLVHVQLAGFHACALRADDSVACADVGDTLPQLTVVDGLPP
jgi:hypothetical protein